MLRTDPERRFSIPDRFTRRLGGIDFFIYSRATPTAAATEHDPGLDEEHWAYMDAFAGAMTARGPTLGPDRETWTGSLHIVDLPSAEAAAAFVANEPYNRAGLFEQHLIRRFENRLGRTMWEAETGSDDPRFLVIARRAVDVAALPLIVHGELFDDAGRAGVALALQAPSRAAVAARLGGDAEIHDWEFGGRR